MLVPITSLLLGCSQKAVGQAEEESQGEVRLGPGSAPACGRESTAGAEHASPSARGGARVPAAARTPTGLTHTHARLHTRTHMQAQLWAGPAQSAAAPERLLGTRAQGRGSSREVPPGQRWDGTWPWAGSGASPPAGQRRHTSGRTRTARALPPSRGARAEPGGAEQGRGASGQGSRRLHGDRSHPATPTLAVPGGLSLALGAGQGLVLGAAEPPALPQGDSRSLGAGEGAQLSWAKHHLRGEGSQPHVPPPSLDVGMGASCHAGPARGPPSPVCRGTVPHAPQPSMLVGDARNSLQT